jgi:DNA adenine methylase
MINIKERKKAISESNSLDKSSAIAKPFLKWAGSKKWLVPFLASFTPTKFSRYYEPFLGSGAVFFALNPRSSKLSDSNKNLMATYKAIQTSPMAVIRELEKMPYDKEFYYITRDKLSSGGRSQRASRFIYLNQSCWNGVYRENLRGQFNVPFGRQKNPRIFDPENISRVSQALRRAELVACDFAEGVSDADSGDFVFFDPPYITGHQDNGFHYYNAKLFSWSDQEKLANLAKELDGRGCLILITNANHQSLRRLYENFNIHQINRKSMIAASTKFRGDVSELVITNY